MSAQINKIHFDVEAERQRNALALRTLTRQTWTIACSAVLAAAGLIGAGVALGRFWLFHI
jgi:hypothetical protein